MPAALRGDARAHARRAARRLRDQPRAAPGQGGAQEPARACRRRSSRRCPRARSSRAPRSPAPASSTFTSHRPRTRASSHACTSAATPTARARSAQASGCWSSSSPPTPPVRCTSGTAGRRPSARRSPTCSPRSGFKVEREYYINDAGRQMDILAVSTWLRYLELAGETLPFPAERLPRRLRAPARREASGRRGRCVCKRPAAQVLAQLPAGRARGRQGGVHRRAHRACRAAHRRGRLPRGARAVARGDARRHPRRPRRVRGRFDHWTSRARLCRERGDRPRARGARSRRAACTRQDGALWFRATEFGDEKDRVVVRENGQKTYFASDIAYHLAQVRARLRAPDRRARRRPPRLRRARARGAHGHGAPRGVPRGHPDPVREPVPRHARRSRWASARRSS